MAYAFAAASSQSLTTTSSPVAAVPLTIACWFYPTVAATQAVVYVGKNGGVDRNGISQFASGGNVIVQAFSASTATPSGAGSSSAAMALNQWHHAAAVFSSATSRTAYANGTAGTENTSNIDTSAVSSDSIVLGSRWSTTLASYLSGRIADVGVWNVALDAAEIASLAKGVSCRLIRPQRLVFYAPLIRGLADEMRALTITNNNTATVAVHPRIYA